MKHFEHISPSTLEEASSLLNSGDAVLSAGGTDLVGVLKEELLPHYPSQVVSMKRIPGLDGIEVREDGLHLVAQGQRVDDNARIRTAEVIHDLEGAHLQIHLHFHYL